MIIHIYLEPKYIIETRATNGDELSRVSTFLEWSQKDQPPVPNDLLSGFMRNWGGIRSVSPSEKYLLCIRNVKEINGFEVCVIESESYKEVCRVRFEGYSAASGLFSGIAWDREERNIAYCLSILLIHLGWLVVRSHCPSLMIHRGYPIHRSLI